MLRFERCTNKVSLQSIFVLFQVRSDWFVYAVLYALPWVGAELTEKKANDLSEMLDAIKRFLDQRQKLHVQMLRVWSGDKPHIQEEYLDCLWAQVGSFRAFYRNQS